MRSVDYMAAAERAIAQIKKDGAFLTAKAGSDLNTMTIGWALLGFVWGKPILMVAVRKTRHTFSIMERAADFTVSVPTADMHEALMFCGTRSGREVDKYRACGIKTKAGLKTTSPVLQVSGIHFECRIVLKSPMDPTFMDKGLEALYLAKDYHTLYFGEIQECYETE
ncbi:MAG: flavin reductase family protein [Thermodesulfobacteriota bacterium]